MAGFLSLILLVLVVIFGLRWMTELSRRSAAGVERGPDPRRLERVEAALASLEARLDQLQEQQRFMERLLAGRREPGTLPPGESGSARAGEGDAREGEGDDRVDSILFDTDRGES